MSRAAVAAELQSLLEQIQRAAVGAERIAESSKLLSASYFRGIQSITTMAAGELDQKGLLTRPHAPPVAPPIDVGHG